MKIHKNSKCLSKVTCIPLSYFHKDVSKKKSRTRKTLNILKFKHNSSDTKPRETDKTEKDEEEKITKIFISYHMSRVRCHLSYVLCHVQHVACHLLPVTCQKRLQPQPQNLPLVTPPSCTEGWFAKTQKVSKPKKFIKPQNLKMCRGIPILAISSSTRSPTGSCFSAMAQTHRRTNTLLG